MSEHDNDMANAQNRDRQLYFGGVPTEPDVKRILDKWGVPTEGQTIGYDDIEALIHTPRTAHRFRTVTHAWRSQLLRAHNVRMLCVDGVGFCAGTPEQRLNEVVDRSAHVRLHLSRTVQLGRMIDGERLPDPQRKALQHHVMANAAHVLAMQTDRKRIKAGLPPSVSEK